MEVQDGKGGVWFRVIGWQDIIFRYARPLLETQQHPTRSTIARDRELAGLPENGLAVVLQRDDLRDAQPERLAQLYLNRDEMGAFRSLTGDPRRQRQWLMGRIAAKDAARLWLSRTAGEPFLHPVQLTIGNDEKGRPFVRLPGGSGDSPAGSAGRPVTSPDGASISDAPAAASWQAPSVSMAHTAAMAVAVASSGPAGIDVEAADAGSRLTLEDFAADTEIDLLAEAGGGEIRTIWVTRLWCAKESAAKLLGGGLQGRPKRIRAIRIRPDGSLLMQTGEAPGTIEVHTSEIDGSLIATARPARLATEDPAADEAHLS
jgi:phosphopantetheinyl transferase (holo-ACP synthase)